MGINLRRILAQAHDQQLPHPLPYPATPAPRGVTAAPPLDLAAVAAGSDDTRLVWAELLPAIGPTPPTPRALTLVRITLAPGGWITRDDDDATSGVVVVETGTLWATLPSTRAWPVRVGQPGGRATDPDDPDRPAGGRHAAQTLTAGDSVPLSAFRAGTIHNLSPVEAVAVAIILAPRATPLCA